MVKLLKWASIALLLLIVSGSLLLFFPTPPLLKGIAFSQAVYDDNQHLLRLTLSEDQKYRVFVPLNKIPPELLSATLLQEDQYFHWHFGINPFSLIKAAWQTYIIKSRRVGASTITMQLARIRYGIHSKTFFGKILQIIRAQQIEMHYSKKQILEAYLNLAPYGKNIEGVGAASLIYYGQSVTHLTLPEELTLAVIPQNPTQRTPQETQLKEIRNRLFSRWVKQHPTDKDKLSLSGLPLQMQSIHHLPYFAPHFVNTVLEKNHQQTLNTTLDLNLQLELEKITRHYLASKNSLGINNAAVLVVDSRDMSIKTLIGSADFFNKLIEGQIDGTRIKRSPGSTLKPFIYALALDQGLINPDTVLKDVPHSFGSYNPENFDNDFMGPIHAKDALILSRNIPAIYLSNQLKNLTLYRLLQKANVSDLKSEQYYGLALALGGAEVSMQELTELYAMLANNGRWKPLRFESDETQSFGEQLISPEASFLVLDMLKNTPRPLESNILGDTDQLPVSWKTGTSSGFRDAWSVGVIGPYVLTVWVGNFDNQSNHALIGKEAAAPLFFQLIEGMYHSLGKIPPSETNSKQLNLTQVAVCKASGLLPTRYCHDTEMTWFIPGKSPIKTDNIYREVAIDKKTGLRACHFDKNTTFKIFEFWPSDLLKVFKEAGIERETPPPFDANCSPVGIAGLSPQITSPQLQLSYIIHSQGRHDVIPFSAVTDADVKALYWFLGNAYLGKSSHDQALNWPAKSGHFVVRVVDDHGRSDARDITVTLAQ